MKTLHIIKTNLIGFILLAVVSACGGMDESYKDFIGDKPIVYLARNESDSIKVQYGRERVRMTIPPTMDPRIEYVKVTWNNGMYEKKVPVVYKEPTVFIIDENLPEGMYDFVITNHTEDGLYSISASATGETYGATYESYLRNRNIQKIEVDMTTSDMILYFPMLSDSIIEGTELKWMKDGIEKTEYFPNTEDNMISIENFPYTDDEIGEFQYRVHVLPNKDAIDVFYSEWQTCRFQVEEEVVPALIGSANWNITTSYPTLVDGSNGPAKLLIDGNPKTFMSLRKPGKNGIPEGTESYFTIDMGEENKFDYIEWYHRGNDTQLGLRAWAIVAYGSNDGMNFTKIGNDINIPGETDKTIMNATFFLPESTWRYLKIEFTRWDKVNNSAIQVGEFKLGYSKTQTGKGVGVVL